MSNKLIVETTGAFMLTLVGGNIEAFRPSVVENSERLQQHISEKRVKVLVPDVDESATDESFAEFYRDHDKDKEAAIENFLNSLSGEPEAEAPKKTTATKTAAKPAATKGAK